MVRASLSLNEDWGVTDWAILQHILVLVSTRVGIEWVRS